MSDCIKNKENQIDILYSEASKKTEDRYFNHLKACSSCKKEHENLIFLRKNLNISDIETPQILVNKVLSNARENFEVRAPIGIWAKLFNWFNIGMAIPSLVVFIFVGTVGIISYQAYESSKKDDFFANLVTHPSADNALGSFSPVDLQGISLPLRERLKTNPFAEVDSVKLNALSNPSRNSGLRASPISQTYSFDYNNIPNQVTPDTLEDLKILFEQRRKQLMEKDADELLMRGRRLKSLGRIDLAIQDFETIYQFYPDYSYLSDVLLYRAQCYALIGKDKKAKDSLNELALRYPGKKDLINNFIEQLSKDN